MNNCINCHDDYELEPKSDFDSNYFCSTFCEKEWTKDWENKTGWDKIEGITTSLGPNNVIPYLECDKV